MEDYELLPFSSVCTMRSAVRPSQRSGRVVCFHSPCSSLSSEAERAKLVSGIARLAESRGIVTGYGDGSFRPGTSATPMRNTAGMPRRPRPSPLPAAATPSAPATRPSATSPLPSGPESGRWSPKTAPPPSTLSSDIPSCGAPLRHSCADNTVFSETLPYRKKNTPLFRSGEKREMQGR